MVSPYGPAVLCSFNDKKEVIPIKKGEIIVVMGKIGAEESLSYCTLRIAICKD
jgi:hypothetical protein